MNIIIIIILISFLFLFKKNKKLKKESFTSDNNCSTLHDLLDLLDESKLQSKNADLIEVELQLFSKKNQNKIKKLLMENKSIDEIKLNFTNCSEI